MFPVEAQPYLFTGGDPVLALQHDKQAASVLGVGVDDRLRSQRLDQAYGSLDGIAGRLRQPDVLRPDAERDLLAWLRRKLARAERQPGRAGERQSQPAIPGRELCRDEV